MEKLKRDEGVRAQCYQDTEGLWTIGVGRLIDPSHPSSGLTDDEIDYLLSNDIERVEKQLEKRFRWFKDLDDARQYVLLQMCFNLGITRLSKFVRMLSHMERGDFESAAIEQERSKWFKQVGKRAERLQAVMRTGDLSQA